MTQTMTEKKQSKETEEAVSWLLHFVAVKTTRQRNLKKLKLQTKGLLEKKSSSAG